MDTLGHRLTLLGTSANEPERAQVDARAAQVQEVTGASGTWAYVDAGYTGDQPAADALQPGMQLAVVTLPAAHGPKRGFGRVPRRWVGERDFAGSTRFRRLVREYERLPTVLAGLHFVVFACLMLGQLLQVMSSP